MKVAKIQSNTKHWQAQRLKKKKQKINRGKERNNKKATTTAVVFIASGRIIARNSNNGSLRSCILVVISNVPLIGVLKVVPACLPPTLTPTAASYILLPMNFIWMLLSTLAGTCTARRNINRESAIDSIICL